MCKTHIILVLVLFVLVASQSPAQYDNVVFKDLDSYQGLSNNIVRAVVQDKYGFLWFGAQYGLYKYDGYKFTPYFHDPEDPNSLSSNWVMCLQVDSSGSIWIGTRGGGVNRFDPSTEKFTRFIHDETNSNSLCDNNIICLKNEDVPGGDMWIGTQNGLSRLHITTVNADSEKFTFTNFKHDPKDENSLSFDYIQSIYKDNNSTIWIGTLDGCLHQFNEGHNNFNRIYLQKSTERRLNKNYKNVQSIAINFIRQNPEDPSKSLIIGDSKGIYRYDISQNTFHPYSAQIDSLQIWYEYLTSPRVLLDKSGTWWFGPPRRLYIINMQRNISHFFLWSTDPPHGIKWSTIGQLFEDRQGIIWATLWAASGIQKYDKTSQLFRLHELKGGTDYYNINALSADITDEKRIVWIGSPRHGLLKYDRFLNEFKQFKERPRRQIVSICQVPNNPDILWLGTLGAGLYRFHKQNGKLEKFFHYKAAPSDTPGGTVKFLESNAYVLAILNDNNKLWLGSLKGLFYFDPQFNHYKSYLHNPQDSTTISNDRVSCLFRSRNKTESIIWVGTRNGGLNKFYPETGKFIRYRANPKDTTCLSSDYISSVFEDKSGILWVGTTLGLHRFNKKNNTFSRIIDSAKKLNAEIQSIQEDENGYIWLNTTSGLHKLNPENHELETFAGRFSRWAYSQSPSGEMFYARGNKFSTFYPSELKISEYIPPVRITDFRLFNKSVPIGSKELSLLQKSISETKQIVLSHDQSIFSFEFATLDYSAPLKNMYAHKMEGVDPDWVYTNASRRFTTYTNLDPGEYTFLVKGSNSHGVWNETPTSIQVIITPPWWQTSWAYFIYVILFGLTIYSIRAYDLKRQRLKHALEMEHEHAENLEQVDQMKSKFFANISHEFRTPLTLIEGPVKQLVDGSFTGNIKAQYRLILHNTRRLLRMINQILDLSKIDAGHMNFRATHINVVPLLKGLVMTFSSKADQKNITIDIKDEKEKIFLFLDKEKFETIITNLMSNALKFTPENGKIEIGVAAPPLSRGDKEDCRGPNSQFQIPNTDFIKITISNTGPCIPPERLDKIFDRFSHFDETKHSDHESTGIGLALTKELVELHKGMIQVESTPDKGTSFTLAFRHGHDHLTSDQIVAESSIDHQDEIPDVEIAADKEQIGVKPLRGENPLILIVDDNADVRQFVCSGMEPSYSFFEAENGIKGFECASREIPDLIISDVMMPEMDGFELCSKIKQDERTSHIPLILLTARAAIPDKIRGLETGADDYIAKPFNMEELSVRVANLIEQRKRLHSHFHKEHQVIPEDLPLTSLDQKFMSQAMEIIESNISDPEFDVEGFVDTIHLSRSVLYRKIKALTGQSVKHFIRSIRLKHAAALLKNRTLSVTETAYQVGFNNPAYFSECFQKEFGVLPSHYHRH